MKLVVDAVGVKSGGGATVLLNVLTTAVGIDRISEITLLASPAELREYVIPPHDKLLVIDVPSAENIIGRIYWAYRGLSRYLSRLEWDAFLAFTGVSRVRSKNAVLTFVHQVFPYSHESLERCTWKMRLRMAVIRWLTGRAARVADHVLVQTAAVRDTISQSLSIPAENISVFLPTAQILPQFTTPSPKLEKLRSDLQYNSVLLYVGSNAPHKNLSVVATGLQRMPESKRPKWYATLPESASFCQIGSAIGLGVLNEVELHEAYQNATLLVMPSLTETVGLPMLEAMRVGIPVLAANRPYAHAVCEDAAVFFDPLSPDDFAEKTTELLKDAQWRADLVKRGYALTKRRDATDPYRALIEKIVEVAETKQAARTNA